jgi:hypothetical protein
LIDFFRRVYQRALSLFSVELFAGAEGKFSLAIDIAVLLVSGEG